MRVPDVRDRPAHCEPAGAFLQIADQLRRKHCPDGKALPEADHVCKQIAELHSQKIHDNAGDDGIDPCGAVFFQPQECCGREQQICDPGNDVSAERAAGKPDFGRV